MSVLPKFKSMMTPNRPITRFSTVGPEKVPMTYGQGFGID